MMVIDYMECWGKLLNIWIHNIKVITYIVIDTEAPDEFKLYILST